MLNSKLVFVSENDPAGPACTIVSKPAANLRNILTRQIQSVTNRTDRHQPIAVDAYYRATQRGFEGGHEVRLVKGRSLDKGLQSGRL